jgi:hypothetical protein
MINRRLLLTGLCGALAIGALPLGAQARSQVAAQDRVEALDVAAQRIEAFEKTQPSRRRFGRLEFRGGLVLTSEHKDFGGLSDLVVAPDGSRLLAISDAGSWLSADIVYEGTRPAGLRSARLGKIPSTKGGLLNRKRDHDAESMALLDGNLTRGTVLIGFERNTRIARFPIRDGIIEAPVGSLKIAPDMRRMKSNKGFEALAVLQGGPHKGAVLAFAERLPDGNGHHTGWIWIKGEPRRLAVRDIGEFDLTSVASFGNGDIVLLERRFRWSEGVKMRMRHIKAEDIAPGAVIEGETLVEADMGFEIDNMEGIAISKGPQGETVLTLISDDNFNRFLQRTILLQFTLHADGTSAAKAK